MSVVFWGLVCMASSFLFGGSKSAVIEIINAIGSVFYGPVLVTFLLAMFSKKVNYKGINAGIVIGVLVNLIFSKTMQNIVGIDLGVHIFWIWLNFTGVLLTLSISYLVSYLTGWQKSNTGLLINVFPKKSDFLIKEVYILLGFFSLILILSFLIPQIYS